jgi:hypothetical protein
MSETMLKEGITTPLPESPESPESPEPPEPQTIPPVAFIPSPNPNPNSNPNLNPVSIFTAYFAALDTLRDSTTQHTTILARLTNLSNPNSSLSDTLLLQAKIAINDQILQAYHDFNTAWGWMTGKLMVRLLDLAGVVLEEDQESKIREFDDGMREYKEEEMLVREHGWIWRRWVLGMQGLGGTKMEREGMRFRDLSGTDLAD